MPSLMRHSSAGKRVLIAEDSVPSGELLRLVLEAGGYSAEVVENGARVVEAVADAPYDLVLMDIEMPVMDGYAASRAIRDLPANRARVPVLALTARCDKDEAERCRQAGMDGYLTKPFDPAALLKAIASWAGKTGQPAAASCTADVWNRSTYREIADRLGPARISTMLAMFEAHLLQSLSTIRTASQDIDILTREAHNLVSISGMFGFIELFEVSRQMMAAQNIADADRLMSPLLSAGEKIILIIHEENKTKTNKRTAINYQFLL